MRSAIALTAVAGLAAALPQGIDLVSVADVPTPTALGPPATGLSQVPTYNPTSAASEAASAATEDPIADEAKRRRGLDARAACATQPTGAGPVPSPDTAQTFSSDPQYDDIANNAVAPGGYSAAFTNLKGATSASSYLGYYTLKSYDTIKCQQKCDAISSCYAFNIYIERDPTLDPGAGCEDPPSTTNYKCSLWGTQIDSKTATNKGQYRNKFQVVIRGSNGYNKLAPPPSYPDYTGPTRLGGAINAPLANGKDTYIGMRLFPGPYDPGQCAASCTETTNYDRNTAGADGTYKPCNFYNSYVLSKNGSPLGTYCSFYTQPWSSKYATNLGQYDGDGNYYAVSQSYAYTLSPQDPGQV
ncbi:hypothetical protein K431DRAFT_223218 [Polychaeton citri CBS 116435]|uniref:Apple domain-containing protein n=1 Tax=Polychaeton citri CBS 116435 TaxID=1314669 RepID=A0A9P4UQL9_9PEZI|nr:hypothetical protein K431DRAFT_223218 [Polychaeton citri CBS 116435]